MRRTFTGLGLGIVAVLCGLNQSPNLSAGAFERPHKLTLVAPQIIALDCEEATIQVGELVRYAEQFVVTSEGGGAPGATPRLYICPKDCERGKIYPNGLGLKCPVCKYRLYEFRDGRIEHSNHRPRHGGVFFMGQDGFHHVEGALVSATEFRLYVYDNFTDPLTEFCSATAEYSAKECARCSGTKFELKRSADNSYLSGTLPADLALPLSIAVRIRFGDQRDSMLFNFSFEKITR